MGCYAERTVLLEPGELRESVPICIQSGVLRV
jgi:hypothetical protein